MIELRTAQKKFLLDVEKSRNNGNKKGILIFPTGLGKTLASLSDALRVAGKHGKILVLAHNHNLLYQHARDLRLINKSKKIGFLYKSKKDVNAEVLFANIMTIKNRKYLKSFKKNEFDYIIIDETHHAGAKSYQCIFDYFKPKFLLGMTATPTRTDQIDILPMYDNNIITNINVFDAINKQWLRPYKYVFLWDKWCDYNKIKSYRCKDGFHKYNIKELGRAYYVPERDMAIIREFKKRALDRRGIGFCVSVSESIRMAKLFNDNGIKSAALWGGKNKDKTMSEDKRNKILKDFEDGEYQMLFNCEILGEGLHLSFVDVILKLRPTKSLIKDSQHNGRGLFNIEGLEIENKYKRLLILDWVGNYNKVHLNYIYQGKLNEEVDKKNGDIRDIVELPIGCDVDFDFRVIKEFNKQLRYEKLMSLEDAIKQYHKIYKTKPTVSKLVKENEAIYGYFRRNNLLDKYCFNPNRGIENAIKQYHKIYKTKPSRGKLANENMSIYSRFLNNNMLDEYCYKGFMSLNDAIKQYHKIYKKKPGRRQLQMENPNIYSHFRKNNLVEKYCGASIYMTLKEAIKKYHELYNEKPTRAELEKENSHIFSQFIIHGQLDKYCKRMKKRVTTLKEAIKKYHEIYKEKPLRGVLGKENQSMYVYFRKNNLLDKYCLPSTQTNMSLNDAIKQYHKIYKKKPGRSELARENTAIMDHFYRHGLLDKYCSKSKRLRMTPEEIVQKYHKIYKEKPGRMQLYNENKRIYLYFLKNDSLDKYCLASKSNQNAFKTNKTSVESTTQSHGSGKQ